MKIQKRDTLTEKVFVSLSKSERAALEVIAERSGVSMSAVVRAAILPTLNKEIRQQAKVNGND